MNHYIYTILLTLTPLFELRAAIPYAVFVGGIPLFTAAILVFVINVLLGVLAYFLLDKVIRLACRIKFIDRIYKKFLLKTQKRIHQGVEKYGEWALAVFIGIPLPGSGVYTGTLSAYILGLSFRKFIIAVIIGVLIATLAVSLVVYTGNEALIHLFGIGANIN
ncbi:small multi-drug export protein [Candidatus Woesearchaeota archaeon]|nr:small multi-drug export protein [Candidatus Woesearchaeota archaeon]